MLHNNYILGFDNIKNINVNGYYETKPEYTRDKHNKLGFEELIHQIAYVWGVRFIEHCAKLYGGKYKMIPMIGIKERPPDNIFYGMVVYDVTKMPMVMTIPINPANL